MNIHVFFGKYVFLFCIKNSSMTQKIGKLRETKFGIGFTSEIGKLIEN